MDMLDKEKIRNLAGMEQSWTERFHLATQNHTQFLTYELFFPGIFHLIFSDCS